MLVITVAQEKGGVGKTTISNTLAAGLSIYGSRVVLVDADPQANTTAGLNVPEMPGLYDCLVRDASFSDALKLIHPSVYADRANIEGELHLLPGNVESRNIATYLPDVTSVREKFEELEDWADYIIIDTPPTPSLFHSAIYIATDAVLYPTTCEPQAIQMLDKTIARLKASTNFRASNGLQPISALGIVPTMYRATTLHETNLDRLNKSFGDLVWPRISMRIAWSEAAQVRRSIFAYADPNSEAVKEAWGVVNNVWQKTTVS